MTRALRVEWLRLRPELHGLEHKVIFKQMQRQGLFSKKTAACDTAIWRLIQAARKVNETEQSKYLKALGLT